MKHFKSGGVAKAVSKTLKNEAFEARRRLIASSISNPYQFWNLDHSSLDFKRWERFTKGFVKRAFELAEKKVIFIWL